MASTLALIASALGFLSVGAIIWAVYEFTRNRRQIEDSDDIVLNFMSNQSEHRFLGSYLDMEESMPGRKILHYKPKGLDLRTGKFSKQQIKEKTKKQEAIVDPHKHAIVPKGLLEKDKAIHFLLPMNGADFDRSFQETPIGRGLMWAIEEENARKTINDMLEEGKTRRADILKMIGDGELTRKWFMMSEERAIEALKAMVSEKDKREKTAPVVTPGGLQYGQHH